MKRLHAHVSVDNLSDSLKFYSGMFASEPTVVKTDYAKWLLDDPRVSFAISQRGAEIGLNHLDIEAESATEFSEMQCRLGALQPDVEKEEGVACCCAKSDKYWVNDPSGKVNPFAVEQVKKTGYPVDNLRSKSWDEFATPNAPHMDFTITVCDNAAGEVCPIWPGHPATAHWGFEDPAAIEGTDEEKRAAFEKIFKQILARMNAFVSLPLNMLEKHAIQQEIKKIGDTPVTRA